MQVKNLQQLQNHLKTQGLPPIIVIGSDEMALRDMAKKSIRQFAEKNQYTIVQQHVQTGFNWETFLATEAQADLFSAKKLLDITQPKAGFSTADTKALEAYLSGNPIECSLLILTNKPTAQQKKSRAYQLFNTHGLVMQLYPLKPNELEQWINNQSRQLKLDISQAARQFLIQQSNGQLTSAQQTLTKLSLLETNQTISVADMQAAMTDHSDYNHFQLIDAALMGKSQQVDRLLQGLQQTGSEPVLILWSLCQAIRQLQSMQASQVQTGNPQAAIAKQWPDRRQKLMQAYQRHQQANTQLNDFFYLAQRLDCAIKGVTPEPVWPLISHFVQALSQPNLHRL